MSHVSPFEGALLIADEFTLAEIWLTLHQNGIAWQRAAGQPGGTERRARMTASDRGLLAGLSDLPFARWQALCAAAGQTPLGAIAGAWCAESDLATVAAQWADCVLATGQGVAVSARLAPAVPFPPLASITETIRWAPGNHALIALALVALPEMELDLTAEQFERAPPIIRLAWQARAAIRAQSLREIG